MLSFLQNQMFQDQCRCFLQSLITLGVSNPQGSVANAICDVRPVLSASASVHGLLLAQRQLASLSLSFVHFHGWIKHMLKKDYSTPWSNHTVSSSGSVFPWWKSHGPEGVTLTWHCCNLEARENGNRPARPILRGLPGSSRCMGKERAHMHGLKLGKLADGPWPRGRYVCLAVAS